jgi:hypothetical protein
VRIGCSLVRHLLAGILLFTSCPLLFAQSSNVDRVVVYKRERKLVLLSQGKEFRSYKIALGGEPIGPKGRQGDHRTPEGVYMPDSRNPNSHFYKALSHLVSKLERHCCRKEAGRQRRR